MFQLNYPRALPDGVCEGHQGDTVRREKKVKKGCREIYYTFMLTNFMGRFSLVSSKAFEVVRRLSAEQLLSSEHTRRRL